MTDLPVVRVADAADEDELMELCRRLHQENGIFTLNEDKVRSYLQRSFDRNGVYVGVVGESGQIEGCTCLVISDYYYTDDWHLAELWNFVDKPFRKSRNAEALIRFAMAFSKKIGLPYITGIITNDRTAQKVRLYRKIMGYPAGAFFVHNAHWQNESEQPTEGSFVTAFGSRSQVRKREKLLHKNGAS
jgi:hypothetical protein